MKWQEPPSQGHWNPSERSREVDGIVTVLKSKPGAWALVAEHASRTQALTWKKRGCETRTVASADGKCAVYARWPA